MLRNRSLIKLSSAKYLSLNQIPYIDLCFINSKYLLLHPNNSPINYNHINVLSLITLKFNLYNISFSISITSLTLNSVPRSNAPNGGGYISSYFVAINKQVIAMSSNFSASGFI